MDSSFKGPVIWSFHIFIVIILNKTMNEQLSGG